MSKLERRELRKKINFLKELNEDPKFKGVIDFTRVIKQLEKDLQK